MLRAEFPRSVSVVCYADDRLVQALAWSHQVATVIEMHGVAIVIQRIRQLGLKEHFGRLTPKLDRAGAAFLPSLGCPIIKYVLDENVSF